MGNVFKQRYTRPLPEGAELFTRKGQGFARWTDSRGKRQTAKLTETGDRIQRESAKYSARYRDGSGVVRTIPTGCRSRDAAEAVLSDLLKRADKVCSGIRSAAEDATVDHQTTPVDLHIADYLTHLRSKRGKGHKPTVSPRYVENVTQKLKRICDDCSFVWLRDLNRESIARWCKRQREVRSPLGERTITDYLATMTAFGFWLVEESRLASNPFARLIRKFGGDEKADRRRERRALTADELRRLLHAAAVRPLAEYGREPVRREDADKRADKASRSTWTKAPLTWETLNAAVERGHEVFAKQPDRVAELRHVGRERALIYKTLALTGLRKGELASLTVGQLELDGPQAYAILDAADAKSGQGADVPLRGDLVADLRRWMADRLDTLRDEARASGGAIPARLSHDELLFKMPREMIRTFDRDRAAAGIVKRDERGRTVDVHALRHTFATHLSAAGVSPRTAQACMRHSKLDLTMSVYTDPRLLDTGAAVEALPDLPLHDDDRETAKATGTDGGASLTSRLTSVHGNRCISETIADHSGVDGQLEMSQEIATGADNNGDSDSESRKTQKRVRRFERPTFTLAT